MNSTYNHIQLSRIKRWNGEFTNTEKGRMYFKYNEDDILEILSEHLAKVNGYGTFASTSILFGKPSTLVEYKKIMAAAGSLLCY